MFELHLQGVWFSGLKSQVVFLGSGCRSGGPNHDKSLSLNLSLLISLLLFSHLYCSYYTLFTPPPLGLIIWATTFICDYTEDEWRPTFTDHDYDLYDG